MGSFVLVQTLLKQNKWEVELSFSKMPIGRIWTWHDIYIPDWLSRLFDFMTGSIDIPLTCMV